ncbi:DUF1211 domain-containing protein [Agromyces sp. SYSU K20354]|uniref:TMEM175 family protein n=1 Tax=Agromyces cavernae TaxID=2898659 RepID=UPI001E590F84|nr:TMEM175 family protein [Agromyces cavernae]MCD2442599.1 DUF1211 domain-containing protein [Agromyces cavernae]
MARFRTERGFDRLVNFSDAAVAIAITLLLLPLVDVAVEIEHESLGDLLASNLGTLIAFGFTFAVIARLWFSHHRIFEAAVDYDDAVILINFVWLASIVVMPFTANVLAHSDTVDPGVNSLYIGTVLLSNLTLSWLVVHLRRHPELTVREGRVHLRVVDSLITTGTIALALLLAALFPAVGMFWLLLLVPANVIAGMVQRGRYSTSGRPGAP